MKNISEIKFDKDGLIVLTIGFDDFYIYEEDFIIVFKAMRDWKKSKFAKKVKIKINRRKT